MKLVLPILTGVFLVASFPRFNQGYLAWIAFIPLIVYVARTKRVKAAFLGGFIAGFIQFFVLLIWMPAVLVHYGGLSAVQAWFAYTLLVVVLACYPAVACGIVKGLVCHAGDACILLFPFVWVLSDYALSFSPIGGFPWLLAGYSQSRFLSIIQIADITGIYGISFLVIWPGTAIYWLFQKRGRGAFAWIPAWTALVFVVGCVVYGAVALAKWEHVSTHYQGAMLQENLSSDDTQGVLREKFEHGYARMADQIQAADLLILPESPSPTFFESDPQYRQTLEQLAKRFPLGLVFNNVRHAEDEGDWRYFNSAYFMDKNGVLKGIYDKIHLVPFGEYLPLASIFSFVQVISKDVGTFAAGTDYRLVNIGGHPANAIICFEAVFPDLVRRFVAEGSQLIINLTNDAWYGDSAAPYQHIAIARLRAVENRRFLLRAANSGISAIIEPSGRFRDATPILREAICEGGFDFIATSTFYTRYGNAFVFLCAIISIAAGLIAALRKSRLHRRLAA
jgi:apolipoprotein N-acyltransferase